MKSHIIIIGLFVALFGNTYAESTSEKHKEKYKQHYTQQLIPLLKERMGTELDIQSEADAHEHVTTLANRMATCQLGAIEGCPQKYQDASITPVANGVDLKKANDDLNLMIQTDIKNGDISDQELKTITEAAIEKYKVYLSGSEPNPSNTPMP
jgi:hypothetical protein